MRAVADALLSRGAVVIETDYWRAYKISFLTREQVIAASTDVVRIMEYQALAAAAGGRLRALQSGPCAGGEPAGAFFVCPVLRVK